jgi:hypothetical protein
VGDFDQLRIRASRTGPSEAEAPAARFVGFAPLSLASAFAGDFCEWLILRFAQDDSVVMRFGRDDRVLWVSEGFGAELCSLMEEAGVGGGVDGQAGAEADEVRDEFGIAADEAELAAEFLLPGGRGTPLPPPVREAGV